MNRAAILVPIIVIVGLVVGVYYFMKMTTQDDSETSTTSKLDPNYFYIYYLKTDFTVDSIAINQLYMYPNALKLSVINSENVGKITYYHTTALHNKAFTIRDLAYEYEGKKYLVYSARYQKDSLVTFTGKSSVPEGYYFFQTIGTDGLLFNVDPVDVLETDYYTRFAFKKEWKV